MKYAMSRTCYDYQEVMTDKGSIEVQFCIEYEAYGWYKNQPGDIEIIDVTFVVDATIVIIVPVVLIVIVITVILVRVIVHVSVS